MKYTLKIVSGVAASGPVLNSTETYQRPQFSVLDKTGVIWACGGVSCNIYGTVWHQSYQGATSTRTICKISESDVVTLVENGCPEDMIDGGIDGNGNIQMGTNTAIYGCSCREQGRNYRRRI